MSKIRVYIDSGANIHSCHEGEIDLDDLDMTLQEWEAMPEEQKFREIQEVLYGFEYGWEVIGDE